MKMVMKRVVSLLPAHPVKESSSTANLQKKTAHTDVKKKGASNSEETLFEKFKIVSVNSLGHSGRNHCENGTRGYLEICLDPVNIAFMRNQEIRALTKQFSVVLKQPLPNILWYKHEGKTEEYDSLQKVLAEMTRIVHGFECVLENASVLCVELTPSEKILVGKIKDLLKKFAMRFKIEKSGFGATMSNYMRTDYHYRRIRLMCFCPDLASYMERVFGSNLTGNSV